MSTDRTAVTAILATNLFTRVDDAWLMIHHHASHVLSSAEVAES